MYPEIDESLIRNTEREYFRVLKNEENEKREIPTHEDILYLSNFILEPYEHDGDSGTLFLATSKKNKEEKYILKHEFYDCACNEYMYSKIGNKMGIQIASVKLFVVDEYEDILLSDFVCGITYFEPCKRIYFEDIIKNTNRIENWQDYFKMRALEQIFEECDDIEIIQYQHRIYRIDTTAAFTLSDFSIAYLAYDLPNKMGINIRQTTQKFILEQAKQNSSRRHSSWESSIEGFIKQYGERYLKYYFEPFDDLLKITEEDILEWTTILTFFYPNVIGKYFQEYFKNLKFDIQEFTFNAKERFLISA